MSHEAEDAENSRRAQNHNELEPRVVLVLRLQWSEASSELLGLACVLFTQPEVDPGGI